MEAESAVLAGDDLYLRLLMAQKRLVYCPHSGAIYRQWSSQTVCQRDRPELRRRVLEILTRAEDFLRESGELTALRQQAVNIARFEAARNRVAVGSRRGARHHGRRRACRSRVHAGRCRRALAIPAGLSTAWIRGRRVNCRSDEKIRLMAGYVKALAFGTVLLCVGYLAAAMFIRPSLMPDAAYGLLVHKSMRHGAPWNHIAEPSAENIATDRVYFYAVWSPGQYTVPGALIDVGLSTGRPLLRSPSLPRSVDWRCGGGCTERWGMTT